MVKKNYLSLKVVDFFAVRGGFFYIISLLWFCLYVVAFLEGCLVDRYFEAFYFLPLIRDVGITSGVIFYYVAGWIIIDRILKIPDYIDEIWSSHIFDKDISEIFFYQHFYSFFDKRCYSYVNLSGIVFLILYLVYEYFSYYLGFDSLNIIFCTNPLLFPKTYLIYVIINSFMAFLAGISLGLIFSFLTSIGNLYDGSINLKHINPLNAISHNIIGKIAYDFSIIFIIGIFVPLSQYLLGIYFVPLVYHLFYYRAIIDVILLLVVSFIIFIYPVYKSHIFVMKQKNDLIKMIKHKYDVAFYNVLSTEQTESFANIYSLKQDIMEISEWPVSQYLQRKIIFSHILMPAGSIIFTTIIEEVVKKSIL